eukprot:7636967-Pyramimonas_sp.AAC.1
MQDFDVSEYDEVYAAYHDARKRFNDLKLARGYYPVVAMVPGATGSSASAAPRRLPSKGGAKGRGRSRGA